MVHFLENLPNPKEFYNYIFTNNDDVVDIMSCPRIFEEYHIDENEEEISKVLYDLNVEDFVIKSDVEVEKSTKNRIRHLRRLKGKESLT